MKVYKEISLRDFDFWAGATDTAEKIDLAGKWNELEELLEECYPKGIGETELNDLLWFEDEWIFTMLGISNGEEDEEEEEE